VTLSDRHMEVIASTREISRVATPLAQWFGLAPDDSLLVLRDVGTHEIYAFDWDAP